MTKSRRKLFFLVLSHRERKGLIKLREEAQNQRTSLIKGNLNHLGQNIRYLDNQICS